MGYPRNGVTYLEKIQGNKKLCKQIKGIYYTLLSKKCRDDKVDNIELSLEDQFKLLAEAFCLVDDNGTLMNDDYTNFMKDVLDCLLKPKGSSTSVSIGFLSSCQVKGGK